jgi:hypothetical protein
MPLRAVLALLAVTLLASGGVLAQVRVRTETIRPPAPAPPAAGRLTPPARDGGANARTAEPSSEANESPPAPRAAAGPDIITDFARLPGAVARTRERILKAARSGDPQKLSALMQASGMPVFSHTQKQDPAAVWKESFPDSEGVEILSILISILETGLVRLDADTPQETYLWPYFARLPLKTLTPAQKVDLFRIVTGADYKDMLEVGRYAFYRVGIGPDGSWRYFVAGDESGFR